MRILSTKTFAAGSWTVREVLSSHSLAGRTGEQLFAIVWLSLGTSVFKDKPIEMELCALLASIALEHDRNPNSALLALDPTVQREQLLPRVLCAPKGATAQEGRTYL